MRSGTFSVGRLCGAALCVLLPMYGQAAELVGIAVMDAEQFVPGPGSGHFIEPANGVVPPFSAKQPIQGISALDYDPERRRWLGLIDNGFGSRENSADYLLRVVELRPQFKTAVGGSGLMSAKTAFLLSDPQGFLRVPITAQRGALAGIDGHFWHVPQAIRKNRWLTGADLDPESMVRLADGSFWFGDEFGPFLVHTDRGGRILEPPVPVPGLFAPQNPFLGDSTPNVAASGGFEGMSLSEDASSLIGLLEKPLAGQHNLLNAYRFSLLNGAFTGDRPVWRYPLSDPDHRIGALKTVDAHRFLVIERDRQQGDTARFKRIFIVDTRGLNNGTTVKKTLLVDLLALRDPARLASDGVFRFPFVTIEGVVVVDRHTIAVINDNNYPFSVGRHLEAARPDDTELILVRLDRPLY